MGILFFGERYETVFITSENSAPQTHANAEQLIKNTVSTQTLNIPQGEVAYLHLHHAQTRPSGNSEYGAYYSGEATIRGFVIDYDGLESNNTIGSWDTPTNFVHADPIVGPARVKIWMRPSFHRQRQSYSSNATLGTNGGNWDFKASEGFVTFRIIGTAPSTAKKFATVIPENSSTNVRVVLEQSTDLINWTAVNPGVFTPSTSKRFFRVRSEEE